MKTVFADLLSGPSGLSAGELQNLAELNFPRALVDSHMSPWQRGKPLPNEGRVMLIAIATWSPLDLELLDHLNDGIPKYPNLFDVYVTDIAVFRSLEEVNEVFPIITRSAHTPWIRIWQDGKIQEEAEGAAARDRLITLYDLPFQVPATIPNPYLEL